MSHGKAAFDRLVTFLLALVFAGLAFWAIGLHFEVAAAERIGDYANRDFWSGLTDRDSYTTILVLAAVVLGLLGIFLVGMNIGRSKLGRMVSPASSTAGTIRTSPTDIGSAVAQSLGALDDVTSASHRTTRDRGTDVVQVKLRLAAEADVRRVLDACDTATEDMTAALPGQDVRPRFLIETDRPARQGR
ncbi:MAG TPA: hypothetical protein H9870_04775 [Candidatus Corynebacterium avicola]|uniref:Alkaline shock response membrane anchor protein AmaP n=1 Tax=Candidatus Corynebacterium avicola TaxID=2838527 RepID=A0A9D1ULM6_9CORY|nr:hypothetical protein [Candidatus Corynebacterium avicola]